MTIGPEEPAEKDRFTWLNALHEAIVAGQSGNLPPANSQDSNVEDLSALRDCLHQLERARLEGDWQNPPAAADETPPLIGEGVPPHIGKFEIRKTLGNGGQGIVFLAFDSELRRQVALKVPKPDALAKPDQRRRFLREAHAAAGLNHPAVVAVHEIGEVYPACFLVTDYCEGGSLQDYLHRHPGQVPPRRSLRSWLAGCNMRMSTASCIATSSLATSFWWSDTAAMPIEATWSRCSTSLPSWETLAWPV